MIVNLRLDVWEAFSYVEIEQKFLEAMYRLQRVWLRVLLTYQKQLFELRVCHLDFLQGQEVA